MSDQEKDNILDTPIEDASQPIQNNEQGGDESKVTDVSKKMERVVKLSDLNEEKEYSDNEFDEMVKLYEETMNEFVEGEVIVGKVLAITDKEVAIDIGFKSEGSIPIDEFNSLDDIKIGDDIEVFLDNIEDKEGQLVLSKRKADFMRTWDEIMHKYENGEVMQGKCVRRIKGGIVVDLNGIDAFLPGSQIDVKPIRDFDAFIGRSIDFKIVKVNNLRKNIVVSHRVLVEEKLGDQRKKILDQLHIGQILEGT
ncbi:S1 RNA-binding domain-containing protein, partial [candidate division KSB1 bacterium]|nr:S1 RNA-binding domain-containing protein [candidate division KSB1 bacterium]